MINNICGFPLDPISVQRNMLWPYANIEDCQCDVEVESDHSQVFFQP